MLCKFLGINFTSTNIHYQNGEIAKPAWPAGSTPFPAALNLLKISVL